MEFTKEQLINQAREEVDFWRERDELIPSQQTAIRLRMAEITLAALTAEPVAWTDEQELRDVAKDGCGYLFTVKPITPHADPRRVIKLYATPPGLRVPDGYALVPVEPTEDMVIHGFESVPHPLFQPADWDKYQTMSGCEQAAHRAKLCWAAMIAAAPQQEDPQIKK